MQALKQEKNKEEKIVTLPYQFYRIQSIVLVVITFLVVGFVFYGCEVYKAQFRPGISAGKFFVIEASVAAVSAGCIFMSLSVIFPGIIRLFLLLIGKSKRLSAVEWIFVIDLLLVAIAVPSVLKALEIYRSYHPAPYDVILVEKYFAFIFTLFIVSFGGVATVVSILMSIKESKKNK